MQTTQKLFKKILFVNLVHFVVISVEQSLQWQVEWLMKTATLRSRARHWWRQEIRPLLILALILSGLST